MDAIAVPAAIASDGRRRIAFRLGVQAARELGLDIAGLASEDLIALGRQTVADHAMSGTPDGLLRRRGAGGGGSGVEDAAWASGDKDKVAAQASAFLRCEFKDELDL